MPGAKIAAPVVLVVFGLTLSGCGETGGSSADSQPSTQAVVSTPPAPVPSGPTKEARNVYASEYVICQGITLADIRADGGFRVPAGATPEEGIVAMEQQSYRGDLVPYAIDGCLDAYRHRSRRY